MLVPLQEKDFDKYVEFAYELALDPTRCGYPAYFDGIKTREDFITRARKAFSRPGEEILLYQADGAVEGWIHYCYLADDHHLSARSCYVRRNTAQALQEFSEYLTARFPGCDCDMGFPEENREAIAWLEGAGFTKLEDSQNYQLFFDQYVSGPEDPAVERVTEENFEKFQQIHRTIEGTMYWNCQRVRKDLSIWDLFVAEEDSVAGEIMVWTEFDGWYEVVALGCEDGKYHEGLFRRLLAAALNAGKRRGAKHLTFFVDTGSEEDAVIPELGFQLVGRYIAYRKRI